MREQAGDGSGSSKTRDNDCACGRGYERMNTTLLRGFVIWVVHIDLRLEQSRFYQDSVSGKSIPGGFQFVTIFGQ
jgi:hypothetical protein